MNTKQCIFFLADGARYDVFKKLLDEGSLPNIKKVFVDNQGTFAKAVSSFPTTTGPAYTPFLTGCYPGTCNIPGIRWLDRNKFNDKGFSLGKIRSYVGLESYLINKDLSPHVKTLFELFKKPLDIHSSMWRGAKEQSLKFLRIPLVIYGKFTQNLMTIEKFGLKDMLKGIRKGNDFIFFAFHSLDEYAHNAKPLSEKVLNSYRFIDKCIGDCVNELKRLNKFDDTLLVLTSDHGHEEVSGHLELSTILEDYGLDTLYYPKIFRSWKNVQAACMVSGNSMAHIYLKNGKEWTKPCYFNDIKEKYTGLLERLLKQEEIALIAVKNKDNEIVVLSEDGESYIHYDDQKIYYKFDGKDPLEINENILFHNLDEILQRTINTNYPDSINQLIQIFKSNRSGDIIVNASQGFDLRKNYEYTEHFSTHGSLRKLQMLVPFCINKKISKKVVRTIDIFPSILDYCNIPYPKLVEGESLKIVHGRRSTDVNSLVVHRRTNCGQLWTVDSGLSTIFF